MATHPRQAIRHAVAALLSGETAAGTRVHMTRVDPWRSNGLPALAVYALEEPVDAASLATAPRELARQLKLVVQAAVEQAADADDALDAICVDIERVMDADDSFGGLAASSILENTEIGVISTGRQLVGSAILTYAVTYYTYAPDAANVTLEDFTTAHAKTSLGGAQAAADQAEVVVTLPTE